MNGTNESGIRLSSDKSSEKSPMPISDAASIPRTRKTNYTDRVVLTHPRPDAAASSFRKSREKILQYRVFYSAVRLGDISAENAIDMELADVYSEVLPVLKEHREYFGLVDSDGTTLQVMYDEEKDQYWFEVPRPDLGGSFGVSLSFDAALDLIKSLDDPFPPEGFEGFEFQSWS